MTTGIDPLFFVRLDPLVVDSWIQWFIAGPAMFRHMLAPKKSTPSLVIGAKTSRTMLLEDGWDAKTVADHEARAQTLVMQLTREEENRCQWSSIQSLDRTNGRGGSPRPAAWPDQDAVANVGVPAINDALADLWIQRHCKQ